MLLMILGIAAFVLTCLIWALISHLVHERAWKHLYEDDTNERRKI